jgi:hypothetical protein
MHSAKELSSEAFSLTVDGNPARLEDVFPWFQAQDRLGVVVRHPGGVVGASVLIMAAVTRFYDYQRSSGRDFFIYPDYFVFHVGEQQGDHSMFDIWPGHKEVVVPDDPEEILRAINDRGITRLLVEDGTPGSPRFERYTRESAESRIRSALAYAPSGIVQDPDVTGAGNDVTESYVQTVLEKSVSLSADVRDRRLAERQALMVDGVAVESYRRLNLDIALGLLAVPSD